MISTQLYHSDFAYAFIYANLLDKLILFAANTIYNIWTGMKVAIRNDRKYLASDSFP